MKVCIVSKHYPPYPGGLESRVRDVSKWFSDNGEHVIVLTSKDGFKGTEHEDDNITVMRSNTLFNLFNSPFTPGILCNLLLEDYDFIDVNLPDPINSIFCLLASFIRGKPLFVTYHADIIKDRAIHKPYNTLNMVCCLTLFLEEPNRFS